MFLLGAFYFIFTLICGFGECLSMQFNQCRIQYMQLMDIVNTMEMSRVLMIKADIDSVNQQPSSPPSEPTSASTPLRPRAQCRHHPACAAP